MPFLTDEQYEKEKEMLTLHALLQAAVILRATMNFTTVEAVEEAMRLRNRIREIEI
jgi:hypothetical protein